jgi:hypothetical protein
MQKMEEELSISLAGNPATVADEEGNASPRYTTRFSDLLVVR